jgi:hypothetical protein
VASYDRPSKPSQQIHQKLGIKALVRNKCRKNNRTKPNENHLIGNPIWKMGFVIRNWKRFGPIIIASFATESNQDRFKLSNHHWIKNYQL